MLSGVTHETRVLCSKLCSTGGIMLKLCHTKMILPPHPYSPAPKKNIPSLSFLKLMLDNNCSVKPFMGKWSLEAWNKQVTRPSIVSKSLGTSLRYQVLVGVGLRLITSRCRGNEPALLPRRVDQTQRGAEIEPRVGHTGVQWQQLTFAQRYTANIIFKSLGCTIKEINTVVISGLRFRFHIQQV